MVITNHVLAGSLIGIGIKEPTLAITLAFVSHFVMDALPHFGYPGRKGYPVVLDLKPEQVMAIFRQLVSEYKKENSIEGEVREI